MSVNGELLCLIDMGALRGVVLGAANVLVIGIGIGVLRQDLGLTPAVIMYGGIPGLFAGAVLGVVAQCTEARPPWLRAVVLAVPAVGLVVFLAALFEVFGMYAYVPVACIPTIVAALILERWTRRPPPAPVPVARVLATRA